MCGIAGFVSWDDTKMGDSTLAGMSSALAHRGSDGKGFWISPHFQVGLTHRRMAVIDIGSNGDQPMHYLNRYHIVFNGEIYNYLELRSELEKTGHQFISQSDTEVLLALYAQYKECCLEKLDGMFSFLIYDDLEDSIFAAVDRFGEKPFFYNHIPGGHFLFASEMKALWAAGVEKKTNPKMLFNYLAYGYVTNFNDESETFYDGCTRLPHSHYLKLKLQDGDFVVKKYYDIDWQKSNTKISFEDALEKFQFLFNKSISFRLRSDVNLGCSLSGGLDSSVIVASVDKICKEKNRSPFKTFSVRIPGFDRDEGKFIDLVTQKCRVDPVSIYPKAEEVAKDLDHIFYFQEEPFGDAGILMQYMLMKEAKKQAVTVLLDGQGADEILGGYMHYFPMFFKEMKSKDRALAKSEYQAYVALHKNNRINPIHKNDFKSVIKHSFPGTINRIKKYKLLSQQLLEKQFNSDFFATYKDFEFYPNRIHSTLNSEMYQQLFCGDLQSRLRFADRNSMAHARELRLPYLNHELVEFAYSLPATYKIHAGWTKYILRQSFRSILPPEIYGRVDKIGYESPQKQWMAEKPIQEKIIEARETLLKENIIHKNILKTLPVAHSSYEMGDRSWRHLMAALVVR